MTSWAAREKWTHALRRPGPEADRCIADVGGAICACVFPEPSPVVTDGDLVTCEACGHEVVRMGVGPPSNSPVPGR